VQESRDFPAQRCPLVDPPPPEHEKVETRFFRCLLLFANGGRKYFYFKTYEDFLRPLLFLRVPRGGLPTRSSLPAIKCSFSLPPNFVRRSAGYRSTSLMLYAAISLFLASGVIKNRHGSFSCPSHVWKKFFFMIPSYLYTLGFYNLPGTSPTILAFSFRDLNSLEVPLTMNPQSPVILQLFRLR